MQHRWVIGTLCGLLALVCIGCIESTAVESQRPSRHRNLQQVTYITSYSNLPGFVPVQEVMTHENPPPEVVYVPANRPQVVYVPAPPAPPPPSLAEYIVAPYPPSLPAPAPAKSPAAPPQHPPSPSKPPSPAKTPKPSPPPSPPPSPFAPASPVPEATPSPTTEATPSPASTPNPIPGPTPGPTPGATPAPLAASPAATSAPATAAGLFDLKGAVSGKSCQSIWQIINQDPDLKSWVSVLQGKGLSGTFNSTTNTITMFAPVNAAFSQNIFSGQAGTNGANNLQQLLSNRPDAVNPIIGYNILPATYNVADLTAGKSLQTTDTAKSGNSVQGTPQTLTVNVTSNSGNTAQLKGVGGSVNILQGDIAACGPSVIHITDNALLPLTFTAASSPVPVSQQG